MVLSCIDTGKRRTPATLEDVKGELEQLADKLGTSH